MVRAHVLIAAAALVLAGLASAAAGPRVALRGGGTSAVAGAPWRATLVVTPATAARPAVTLRGPSVRRARVRRVAAGRYSLTATFPTAGRWRVEARIGARRFALRTVVVRAAPVVLREPAQIALDPSGRLLVAENGGDRVVRVDPATGRVARVAALVSPFGLAFGPAGELYATSDERLVRVGGGVVARSEGGRDIGPVAVDGSGRVYFVAEGRIYRVEPGSGAVRYGGTGVDGCGGDGGTVEHATFGRPHGLAFARDGALIVADSENGRIRRVDPGTRVVTTIATGLGFPAGLVVAGDGAIWVAEIFGHTVRRIAPGGGVAIVAGTGTKGSSGDGGPATSARLDVPGDVEVAADGTAYVIEAGRGRIRRIDPAGVITTLRLRR